MKTKLNPMLSLGLVLNALHLLLEGLPFFARPGIPGNLCCFLGGCACALVILGALRQFSGEENWNKLTIWKRQLFGG